MLTDVGSSCRSSSVVPKLWNSLGLKLAIVGESVALPAA